MVSFHNFIHNSHLNSCCAHLKECRAYVSKCYTQMNGHIPSAIDSYSIEPLSVLHSKLEFLCNFSMRLLKCFWNFFKIFFCPQKVEKTTLKSCSEFLKSTFFPLLPAQPKWPKQKKSCSKMWPIDQLYIELYIELKSSFLWHQDVLISPVLCSRDSLAHTVLKSGLGLDLRCIYNWNSLF